MKKKFLIIVFLLFSSFSYSQDITISADYLEYDEDSKIIKAEGNVQSGYKDLNLKSDKLRFDIDKEELNAEGNVELKRGKSQINSSSLIYNFKDKKGILKESIVNIDKLKIKGEETELKENSYLIKNGEFTSCEEEIPHYKLQAKEFLISGEKVTARKISLRIKKKRIFTLHKISFPLKSEGDKNKTKNIFAPKLGISGREMIFLRWSYNYNLSRYFSFSSFYRYSPWFGFQGEINFCGRKNEYKIENIISRRFEPHISIPDSWVIRVPEVRLKKDFKKIPKTEISYWLEGSWGKFEERNFGVESERGEISGGMMSPSFSLSKSAKLKIGLGYDRSDYSLKDYKLRDLKYEIILNKLFNKKFDLETTYINHRLKGNTPFVFDRVELKEELKNKINKKFAKNYNIELISRYDLTNDKIYDTEIILVYKIDCFDITLKWSDRRDLIKIMMSSNLLDFI